MQSFLVKIHEDLRAKTNNSLVRVNIELFDSLGSLRSHLLSDMGANFHADCVFDYKRNRSKSSFDSNAYASLKDDEYISIVDDFRCDSVIENASKEEVEYINALVGSSLFSCLRMSIIYRKKLYGFVYFNSNEVGFFSCPNRADVFKLALEDIRLEVVDYLGEVDSISLVCNSYISSLRSKYYHVSSKDGEIDRIKSIVRFLLSKNKGYLSVSSKFAYDLVEFSPIHDIGKIAIPDNILFKESSLTKNEFDIIKSHPQLGWGIVRDIINDICFHEESKNIIKNIILYHHEKLNGSGYPFGLLEDEIPVEAKVLAVADIYDALTTERAYKPKFTHQKAMTVLRGMAVKNEIDDVLVESLDVFPLFYSECI